MLTIQCRKEAKSPCSLFCLSTLLVKQPTGKFLAVVLNWPSQSGMHVTRMTCSPQRFYLYWHHDLCAGVERLYERDLLGKLFDLSGSVAFVTGSARGVGAAVAEGLARCGAKVRAPRVV